MRPRPGHSDCVECGERINGDIMEPEDEGPMHTDCWRDWIAEQ
jgi:hypothetical protein